MLKNLKLKVLLYFSSFNINNSAYNIVLNNSAYNIVQYIGYITIAVGLVGTGIKHKEIKKYFYEIFNEEKNNNKIETNFKPSLENKKKDINENKEKNKKLLEEENNQHKDKKLLEEENNQHKDKKLLEEENNQHKEIKNKKQEEVQCKKLRTEIDSKIVGDIIKYINKNNKEGIKFVSESHYYFSDLKIDNFNVRDLTNESIDYIINELKKIIEKKNEYIEKLIKDIKELISKWTALKEEKNKKLQKKIEFLSERFKDQTESFEKFKNLKIKEIFKKINNEWVFIAEELNEHQKEYGEKEKENIIKYIQDIRKIIEKINNIFNKSKENNNILESLKDEENELSFQIDKYKDVIDSLFIHLKISTKYTLDYNIQKLIFETIDIYSKYLLNILYEIKFIKFNPFNKVNLYFFDLQKEENQFQEYEYKNI